MWNILQMHSTEKKAMENWWKTADGSAEWSGELVRQNYHLHGNSTMASPKD